MSKRILKWPVAVDDQSHIVGAGPVVSVSAQGSDVRMVYVWTLESEQPDRSRVVRVVGTGHGIDDNERPIGSTIVGPFVWHVVELLDGGDGDE